MRVAIAGADQSRLSRARCWVETRDTSISSVRREGLWGKAATCYLAMRVVHHLGFDLSRTKGVSAELFPPKFGKTFRLNYRLTQRWRINNPCLTHLVSNFYLIEGYAIQQYLASMEGAMALGKLSVQAIGNERLAPYLARGGSCFKLAPSGV